MMTWLFVIIFFLGEALCAKDSINTQIAAIKHAKMKLLIAMPQDQSDSLREIASVLQQDFLFSGQFDVDVQGVDSLRTKKDIQAFARSGFPVVLWIYSCPDDSSIEWRLYNAIQGKMIKGKKHKKTGLVERGWAHMIANMVWPELTSQPGFFTSKIAYCKQVERDGKQNYKHIYIADFDGSHEQPLVCSPTVNVGPRFNKDKKRCLLFYSQFTNENIELKVANMHKKHRSISVFDGVNMLPAFSEDGKKVVYCASKGSGNCQIYCCENKKLIQITDNEGNNISPAIVDDGRKIYFCSDISGRPSIYCFDRDEEKLERLTKKASSMSPSYCSSQDRLAYCQKINGVYQVCMYDCKNQEHQQITFGAGQKSECCWSPCGNYVLYAVESSQKQYLETLNILSGVTHKLAVSGNCSYPAWSTCYRELPVVA